MPQSPEGKREKDPSPQFAHRLSTILYTPVSVDNIAYFADEALDQLTTLIEEVTYQYQSEFEESDAYTGAALEDEACAVYGIEDVNGILERIIAVKDKIATIQIELQSALEESQTIITPPDAQDQAFINGGNGGYEAPRTYQRLLTLAYILSQDFNLEPNDAIYTQGITTGNMVREEPYVRVEVPGLNRMVYVCDEEGNASYVFDTVILDALGITIPELDLMTKDQRNAFLRVTPSAGRRMIQSSEWREVMTRFLSEAFSETETGKLTPLPPRSEFREKKRFLPFTEFEVAVREVYEQADRPGNIRKWYQAEQKNHPEWPANPDQMYQNRGWESWMQLVGREVVEFLLFTEFEVAVREVYEQAGRPGDVYKWYQAERKNHPKWPASPHITYKNQGWESWPQLVGREVVELLSFTELEPAVREVYEEADRPGDIYKWYQTERQNHPEWPAAPDKMYKNQGWESWMQLVGREVAEFLLFAEFVTDVREVYEQADRPGNIRKWYQAEQKNHPEWPASPNQTYQNQGWESWVQLVGREVVEFLSFTKFEVAVREVYEEAGRPRDIARWYNAEQKKHPEWPASPHITYKNQGWMGWPQLVGKK